MHMIESKSFIASFFLLFLLLLQFIVNNSCMWYVNVTDFICTKMGKGRESRDESRDALHAGSARPAGGNICSMYQKPMFRDVAYHPH